jgi:hypothetical protein
VKAAKKLLRGKRPDRIAYPPFLAIAPPLGVEHEPKELRKPKVEGKRFISGLYPARFVGDLQLRSKPRPREEAEPTGRHLPGHWRRQAHGPGWAKHKLIWILPYRTTGETDEKPRISGSNEIALEIQQQ